MNAFTVKKSKQIAGSMLAGFAIIALAVACLSGMGGCTSLGLKQPEPAWVKADRATYDIIAPRFQAYVIADPKLVPADKQSMLDLLTDWQFRLLEAEKAVAPK